MNKLFEFVSKPVSSSPISAGKIIKGLKKIADINIPNDKGETILTVAIKNGHSNVALALLDEGADPHGNPSNVPDKSSRLLTKR